MSLRAFELTARQALTVALLKPGRGSSRNHAMNSSSAMLYTRRVIGEETLSSTSALSLYHLRPLLQNQIVHFRSFYWSLSLAMSCGHYLRRLRTSRE